MGGNDRSGAPDPVLANAVGEWAVATAWAAGCFAFTMVYHDLWRGKPYSWLTANECLALSAIFSLSAALAVGPLHRMGWGGSSFYRLRRPFGVVAVGAAALHVLITLVPMWPHYGAKWIGDHVLSFGLGLVAVLYLLMLAAISWPSAFRRLGADRWWFWQRTAWLTLAVVLAHFLVLGKHSKWLEWWQKRDLPMPPATLWAALAGALVLSLRLYDLTKPRRCKRNAAG
jgi:DMSO/TMAO reductase YedYZ heme-binding membrane subunit